MGERVFGVPTFTTEARADTSAMANAAYMAIAAGTALSNVLVKEIYVAGQVAASAVQILLFARHSTNAVTPTALAAPASDGPKNNFQLAQTNPAVTFTAAGTGPQRSATTTNAKLNLSFNAFGGVVRWLAPPGGEWGIFGVTANLSESSLSGFTGTTAAAVGGHIIYEAI